MRIGMLDVFILRIYEMILKIKKNLPGIPKGTLIKSFRASSYNPIIELSFGSNFIRLEIDMDSKEFKKWFEVIDHDQSTT